MSTYGLEDAVELCLEHSIPTGHADSWYELVAELVREIEDHRETIYQFKVTIAAIREGRLKL